MLISGLSECGSEYRDVPKTAHLRGDVFPADEGQFPSVVSLGYRVWDPSKCKEKWSHACTGTIINEYQIVTAAHCIIKKRDKK